MKTRHVRTKNMQCHSSDNNINLFYKFPRISIIKIIARKLPCLCEFVSFRECGGIKFHSFK